ncbi:hypothetical protein [Constantimarinum furrinae]|uniref:Lipocalin-like domain-containing protein n=1 Tax=Constantimarinum furrinae TaxID=2562285 RepID=A0A7G8PUR7_9FLAO|nr:hypothetical protein [Constantimarinum furrinae]QNJ98083.1 hypothetical protein ALE3EI_1525 [Constantimarinum furrinae]
MMKKRFIGLVMVISWVLVVACSTDDSSNPNSASADQIAETAMSGSWEITYFYDSDKVETGDFSGFSFTFHDDGSLVAVNGNTTVTGTWSVSNSSSSSSDDDGSSNSSSADFNIFFPVPESNKFEDLNDDWDIISVSQNEIKLIDVSGGNGGTDYLTFTKI